MLDINERDDGALCSRKREHPPGELAPGKIARQRLDGAHTEDRRRQRGIYYHQHQESDKRVRRVQLMI